jgi:hypothetical protein
VATAALPEAPVQLVGSQKTSTSDAEPACEKRPNESAELEELLFSQFARQTRLNSEVESALENGALARALVAELLAEQPPSLQSTSSTDREFAVEKKLSASAELAEPLRGQSPSGHTTSASAVA